MPDPKEDVPLPSGGIKDEPSLDDDEQNEEIPAETDPAPERPLDDIIGEDVDDEPDEDESPDQEDVEPGSDAASDDESLGVR